MPVFTRHAAAFLVGVSLLAGSAIAQAQTTPQIPMAQPVTTTPAPPSTAVPPKTEIKSCTALSEQLHPGESPMFLECLRSDGILCLVILSNVDHTSSCATTLIDLSSALEPMPTTLPKPTTGK